MNELSKETIEFLDYNGYLYKTEDSEVQFKKVFDYTTPIVLSSIVFFITLPLFPYGLVFFTLLSFSLFAYKRNADKGLLHIQPELGKFYYSFRELKRRFLFRHVRSIYLRSKFKNEYSSAFKRTNEEYVIIIGIELIQGERYEVFQFVSDYQEPSKEIMEVHDHLKAILSK